MKIILHHNTYYDYVWRYKHRLLDVPLKERMALNQQVMVSVFQHDIHLAAQITLDQGNRTLIIAILSQTLKKSIESTTCWSRMQQ